MKRKRKRKTECKRKRNMKRKRSGNETKMKKKTKTEGSSPKDQIHQYLKQHQGDHYNFEEERTYTVSSGSLLLDIEMGGGIKPGVVRASGVTEGGKTSCALAFARNFQKMDNSMVIYIKSEGRLSKEMIERSKELGK